MRDAASHTNLNLPYILEGVDMPAPQLNVGCLNVPKVQRVGRDNQRALRRLGLKRFGAMRYAISLYDLSI
jgi:hypothetical protein